MEAQRRADADRRPFDRGDERLVEGRQRADELDARRIGVRRRRRERAREKVADVVAGGEDALRAADQKRADVPLAARLGEARR